MLRCLKESGDDRALEIKRDVEAGVYSVDSSKVAEKIIEFSIKFYPL
jgi:anti-sigma28 factor (negative regulator of flagellin synthesis)